MNNEQFMHLEMCETSYFNIFSLLDGKRNTSFIQSFAQCTPQKK